LARYHQTTCFEWRRALYVNDKLVSRAGVHQGLDMGAGYGTTIRALTAGTVLRAGWGYYGSGFGGYGNFVLIQHANGIRSLSAHQSKLLVRAGQRVVAGQPIGRVGSTGASTGNHLHFGLQKNGVFINPVPLMRAHGLPMRGC
jgi:murein DD-endopeptidase MepM/ murein hydrolase activator NlpD